MINEVAHCLSVKYQTLWRVEDGEGCLCRTWPGGDSPKELDQKNRSIVPFSGRLQDEDESLARHAVALIESSSVQIPLKTDFSNQLSLFKRSHLKVSLQERNGQHFRVGKARHSMVEAKVLVKEYVEQYNQRRPHSALGYVPPAISAANASNPSIIAGEA